jgi:sterol desaturase/sphingolipid hydroxylase (fatty acid hydroxylase superfamily)/creatinine amidohydrolase/Fe(II)-dependent formamide hydrolase-like protein
MGNADPIAILRSAFGRWENPFAFFASGEERVYWLYLAWAFVIAGVVFLRSAGSNGSLRSFLRFAFPREVYLSASAKTDYGWFLLCRPIFALLLLPALMLTTPALAQMSQQMLRSWVPGLEDSLAGSALLTALFTLVAILASDLGGFLGHYLSHRVPLLWEFHKVHHSARAMTPITVYRMHPVDDVVAALTGGVGLAATTALFQFVAIGPVSVTSAFGMNIFACLFMLLGSNLRHTHLWIDYGPRLSRILISPAQHQIHHSADPRHFDKNIGFIFAFWDDLFGTLYVPQKREQLSYGLGSDEDREFSDPLKLFWLPFYKAFRSRRKSVVAGGAIVALALVGLTAGTGAVIAADSGSDVVQLEDLTWEEVGRRIASGSRTVLVPTAGHEQNGPHVVLGKHHRVVRHAAEQIARELGDTLVAPVVTYVPEGQVDPPEGHMRYAGTISMPPEIFEAILEHTARSLRTHGFEVICYVGDSGDNQASQSRVAERLNAEWRDESTRVVHVGRYYSDNGQLDWLKDQGIPESEVGGHAGIRDTSEMLYVYPGGVRESRVYESAHSASRGVSGDPTRASAEIGQKMIALKVRAAVDEIQASSAPAP